VDGVPKVRGAFEYASDLHRDGMLWGATLRSPHPHARIVAIDTSAALKAPGVCAVLTHADVPGKKTFGLDVQDQPVLAIDVVRYAGEAVAVVAAEDLELARAALQKIAVKYQVLTPITDMAQALEPAAPSVHPQGNVVRTLTIVHGDPNAPADVWVEGEYETGMQDQAPLGPEAGLAVPAEDGGVDLFIATQWLHADLEQLAPCLDLPPEKVRLHLSGVGGAFGAREDVSMQIHACLLALRTNKPRLYGLTIAPERLHEIRRERRPGSRYAELDNCRYEVDEADAMMRREGIRSINSTSKSIEEIATTILRELRIQRQVY